MNHLEDINRIFEENNLNPLEQTLLERLKLIDSHVPEVGPEEGGQLFKRYWDYILYGDHYWQLGAVLSPFNKSTLSPTRELMDFDNEGFKGMKMITEIHKQRLDIVRAIFEEDSNVEIEDGGVKSFARTVRKVERDGGTNVSDLTRMRLVFPDLGSLEKGYFMLENDMQLVRKTFFNHYHPETVSIAASKYDTSFAGVNTSWVDQKNLSSDLSRIIATEVQLVTRRVRDVMAVNHPFQVSQVINDPTEGIISYLTALMQKATILDFEEMKAKKNRL
jgi:hypothetical protein